MAEGRTFDFEITIIRCPRKPENHPTSPTLLRRSRESCERNPAARQKSAHRRAVVPIRECRSSEHAFHRWPPPGIRPAVDSSRSAARCRKRPIFLLPPMKSPCLGEYRKQMAMPSQNPENGIIRFSDYKMGVEETPHKIALHRERGIAPRDAEKAPPKAWSYPGASGEAYEQTSIHGRQNRIWRAQARCLPIHRLHGDVGSRCGKRSEGALSKNVTRAEALGLWFK